MLNIENRTNQQNISIYERFPELKEIAEDGYPKHVLIIPDGNRRWEKEQKKPGIFSAAGEIFKQAGEISGHEAGYGVLKEVIRDLRQLPIETVTIWGLSTDNYHKRSETEINGLFKIFEGATNQAVDELMAENIKGRFIHIGDKERIGERRPSLKKALERAEEITKENKGQKLCFAIDYGGDDETIKVVKKALELNLNPKTITRNDINNLRNENGLITPADLIIRTSGELRTSGIGWIADNAEFYSISKLLPETTIEDFINGITEFAKRDRRGGK